MWISEVKKYFNTQNILIISIDLCNSLDLDKNIVIFSILKINNSFFEHKININSSVHKFLFKFTDEIEEIPYRLHLELVG